ncbi:hypothetical protein EsHS_00006220 [Epichloe bromicola]
MPTSLGIESNIADIMSPTDHHYVSRITSRKNHHEALPRCFKPRALITRKVDDHFRALGAIGSEQMVYFMVSLDQSIMRGLSVQFCMQAPAPKPNVWTTIQLVRNLKRRLIEGTLPTIVGHRVLIVVDVTADVTLTTTSAPQSSDGG